MCDYVTARQGVKEQKLKLYLSKFFPCNQPVWQLVAGNYHRFNFPKVAQQLDEISINTFILIRNSYPKILDQIQLVKYSNLNVLMLSYNQISSIESFQYWLPDTLTTLQLDYNFLSSVEPLKKCNLSKLKYLRLDHNILGSIRPLLEMNCDELEYINLTKNFFIVEFFPMFKTKFSLTSPMEKRNYFHINEPLWKRFETYFCRHIPKPKHVLDEEQERLEKKRKAPELGEVREKRENKQPNRGRNW